MELNKYFDHTLLKPEATRAQILAICDEAIEYGFASVCVNSCNVGIVAERLSGSVVKTCAVVGFPLGACTTATKVFEASEAIKAGASEIDMVINVGRLKEADYDYVSHDISAVVSRCHADGAIAKVIIETCLLSEAEIVRVCRLAAAAGADFVKTSTGFSTGGATASDVALMKSAAGPSVLVKASGGIRDLDAARRMIDAGADRLGASASVAIMQEASESSATSEAAETSGAAETSEAAAE